MSSPPSSNNGVWAEAPSFQGRIFDYETGLYDFRSRNYDPAIGRYTTRPDEPKYGESAYIFPVNNPVNMRDPRGDPFLAKFPSFVGQTMSQKYYWPSAEAYWEYWLYTIYVLRPDWECITYWLVDAAWDLGAHFWSHDDCLICMGAFIAAGLVAAGTIVVFKVPQLYYWIAGTIITAIIDVYTCYRCMDWLATQPFTPPSCTPVNRIPNPYWF